MGSCTAICASLLPELLPAVLRGGSSASSSAKGDHNSNSGKTAVGTPVLLLHGSRDEVVPCFLVQQTEAALGVAGCAVTRQPFPRGHGMLGSEAEVRACMQFWAGHLAAGPPGCVPGETLVELST